MNNQNERKLLSKLLEGSTSNGLTSQDCHDLLKLVMDTTDPTKPQLNDSYNRRCRVCNISVVHKHSSTGICTDCAMAARADGTYPLISGREVCDLNI
jgi:hypothetical protein